VSLYCSLLWVSCMFDRLSISDFPASGYDPYWAQKLISSSMSWHLSTRKISSKFMRTFLSNLANRQTSWAIAHTSSFVGGNKIKTCLVLLIRLFYIYRFRNYSLCRSPSWSVVLCLLCDAMQARPMPSCGVCVPVCLSRSYILSKRINTSSKFFQSWVAKPFCF